MGLSVQPSVVAAQMEQGPSLVFYMAVMLGISAVVALGLPLLLRRLSLPSLVVAIGLMGPLLGAVGGLVGIGAMRLSGRDFGYALVVSGTTAAAAIWVAVRVARPIAGDLQTIVATVDQVATGDRKTVTGIQRDGEIGRLARSVDQLSHSLHQAEVERTAADVERSTVVSALSHDLRTPLASLLVSVDALQDGMGEPSQHLKAMRQNVLSLERLVDDMFLLARADSGSLLLQAERVDLAELIDEAADAMSPVALVRSINIVTQVAGPIMIVGDHAGLGRVLRNLLDNAIRHAPTGTSVTVQIGGQPLFGAQTRPELGAGVNQWVQIVVVDQGAGFSESFTTRALQRFSQADDARSRSGSSGLGLAISQTIIEAHGGSIAVFPGPPGRVAFEVPLDTALMDPPLPVGS